MSSRTDECTEHLPDQHRVFGEEIRRGCGNQSNAERLQEVVPGELHRQITSEAVGAFHPNDAHAIARDAVEHGLEARAFGNGISAAHGRVASSMATLV